LENAINRQTDRDGPTRFYSLTLQRDERQKAAQTAYTAVVQTLLRNDECYMVWGAQEKTILPRSSIFLYNGE
jgi:hypothetical protein